MKMWVQLLLVTLAAIHTKAIKIPIENTDGTKQATIIPEQIQSLPIYYSSDEANVDTYLIARDPHKPDDAIREAIATPATYLLPPSPESQNEYFNKPTEPGEQTEWYPIAATLQKQTETVPQIQHEIRLEPNEVSGNLRTGKVLHRGHVISVPSINLLPPRQNAPDDFVILAPSTELELPSEEIDHTLNKDLNLELPVLRPPLQNKYPTHFRVKPESVTYTKQPKVYRNPTILYPKKYINEFKPVPIPVSQYADEVEDQNVPTAKPAEALQPALYSNIEYLTPTNDKKTYLYDQSQKKRKLKQQKDAEEQSVGTRNTNEEMTPKEQETSESNHRHPASHVHPARLRKEPVKRKPEQKSKGERTEFRMHGMKGPNSYQFGYDTGKGKNRQFRYEERDNDGHVRGHYGYVDKFGKLRVVNYDADPKLGFRAEAPVVQD